MNGVLIINKPRGCTSFDVVSQARRVLLEKRIGHTGTLDPEASGVLVLCLGEATKLVPFLQDSEKEYVATAELGVSTDTDDAAPSARVIFKASQTELAGLTESAVRATLMAQTGHTLQTPPLYSALKQDGKRLCDRARQAQTEAERDAVAKNAAAKARPVNIYEIEVRTIDLALPKPTVTFWVRCGKGTYIRAIARDLGDKLSVGAHLQSLTRTRVGVFSLEQARSLSEITPGDVLSVHEVAAQFPNISVSQEVAKRLRQGHRETVASIHFPVENTCAIFDEQRHLVAIRTPQNQIRTF